LPYSFEIEQQVLVHIPSLQYGGNHRHARKEALIAYGDLVLYWMDPDGNRHMEHMQKEGKLIVFSLMPWVPHVVINRSPSAFGVVLEFIGASNGDYEVYPVLSQEELNSFKTGSR
jgi:hypothetical protein